MLRLQRWLLRMLAVVVSGMAAGVVALGLSERGPDTSAAGDATLTSGVPTSIKQETSTVALDFRPVWDQQLQRVLFDPPPPPPPKLEKKPPPALGLKLLGTIIDGDSAQAILEDSQRRVAFRRVGDAPGGGDPSAVIEEILPNAVKVRQGEEVTTLQVE